MGFEWGYKLYVGCLLLWLWVSWQPMLLELLDPVHISYVRSNGVSAPSDSPVFLNVLRCATRNCRRAEPFRTLKRFTETKMIRSYM